MIRTSNSSALHDTLIREMVNTYETKGYYNIKADHIGHPNGRPDEVNGFIPDVSAMMNGTTVICEAETTDSLNVAHTVDQWKAFSKSAQEFQIVVPRSALDNAQKIAAQNDISVNQWWYSSQS